MHMSRYFPLYDLPAHLVRRSQQFADAVFEREMAGFGITRGQLGVLIMAELHGGLEQRELAAALALDAATVGGIISRLEARGFLDRPKSNRSRRGRAIYLSKRGKRLIRELRPRIKNIQDQLLSRLTAAERVDLLRLLSKMLDVENSHYLPRPSAPKTKAASSARR